MDNDTIGEFKKELAKFMERMQHNSHQENLVDLNNHLVQTTRTQNTSPRAAFNGFSSEDMSKMLSLPLEPGCPVQLRTLTDVEIEKIPLMRQVLYLMNALKQKEIKLTQKGMLPVKMVETLYELRSHFWNLDSLKQKTENKISEVHIIRVILKETGLTKVGLGKLSITEKGKKLLGDRNALLRTILLFLFTRFHTGGRDRLEDFNLANVGRLYSLWLLHHFGEEWRNVKFYAQEYFKAFPSLKRGSVNKYFVYEDFYTNRIFYNIFILIGLCDFRECKDPTSGLTIEEARKDPILDMVFSFEEPTQI